MPTIGVALSLPEPWAGELQAFRLAVGDQTASEIPTHITLIPPTEIADGGVPDVVAHLEEASSAAPPFRVHLRGTGTFRPVSPVVFVTVVEGISGCEQLANRLRQGPLDVELAFPYHPHVTVAHHLPDEALDRAFAELAGFECVFQARSFHLYVHEPEDGWRPTREFLLEGGPA